MKLERKELILVGDRVLIAGDEGESRTTAGLILPPNALESQPVQTGWVKRVGPGIPIPDTSPVEDEPWRQRTDQPRYLPMQAKAGDYAIFMRKAAIQVQFEGKEYLIVPHGAILLLVRDLEDSARTDPAEGVT